LIAGLHIAILLIALLPGLSQPSNTRASDCYDGLFCIESETHPEEVFIFVRSLVDWDVTMVLDIDAKNLVTRGVLPIVRSIKGQTRQKVVSLEVESRDEEWSYSFQVKWILGDYLAEHQRGFVYELPYSEGESYLVGQGYLGSETHQGKYALDWDMPINTPVRAARAGTVIEFELGFIEGRPDPDLKTKANFVKIRHSDGTIGNYVHLSPNRPVVQIGERVRAGYLIGYSGNTGFTTGPHLHFEVYSATRELDRRTIPVDFNTSHRGAEQLKQGTYYKK